MLTLGYLFVSAVYSRGILRFDYNSERSKQKLNNFIGFINDKQNLKDSTGPLKMSENQMVDLSQPMNFQQAMLMQSRQPMIQYPASVTTPFYQQLQMLQQPYSLYTQIPHISQIPFNSNPSNIQQGMVVPFSIQPLQPSVQTPLFTFVSPEPETDLPFLGMTDRKPNVLKDFIKNVSFSWEPVVKGITEIIHSRKKKKKQDDCEEEDLIS